MRLKGGDGGFNIRCLTSVDTFWKYENGAKLLVLPSFDTVLTNAIGRGAVEETMSL